MPLPCTNIAEWISGGDGPSENLFRIRSCVILSYPCGGGSVSIWVKTYHSSQLLPNAVWLLLTAGSFEQVWICIKVWISWQILSEHQGRGQVKISRLSEYLHEIYWGKNILGSECEWKQSQSENGPSVRERELFLERVRHQTCRWAPPLPCWTFTATAAAGLLQNY